MQTTLLGLGIAIILALVTALVAPLVVDWNQYRSVFETEASRLAGLQVRIKGNIDASILPIPAVTLRNVEIGPAGAAPRMRAESIGVNLALGPLVRGEWRASDLQVKSPEFRAGINGNGRIDWPAIAADFKPDALTIEKVDIDNGRIVLTDARSDARAVIEQLSFSGDLRSLSGPIKGDGGFVYAGGFYPYRLMTGRAEGGALKIHASIDATTDRPLSVDTDGVVTVTGGAPGYDGTLTLAKPAGVAAATGQGVLHEPWRVTSHMKATASTALFEKIDFQYGPDDGAIKVAGAAEMQFGGHPRINGALSTKQVDFDRLAGAPDTSTRLPLKVLQTLMQKFSAAFQSSIPTQLQVSADAVTLGGTRLQSVGGDLHSDDRGWTLDRLEFRGPGFSQVDLSGRAVTGAGGASFNGGARLDATDPSALFSWLAGAEKAPGSRPLHARGDIVLTSERVTVDHMSADLDGQSITGRVAYVWADGARAAQFDADIRAVDINIDAIVAFANAAVPGVWKKPGQISLALETAKATIAGVEAKQTIVRLKADANGLQIDRLAVADFGGATIAATGRIKTSTASQNSAPQGAMTVDLDARDLAGLRALTARYAPAATPLIDRLNQNFSGAKLRATLNAGMTQGDKPPALGLTVTGSVGAIRVNLDAAAAAAVPALDAVTLQSFGTVRVNAALDSDDSQALFDIAGLRRLPGIAQQPGHLAISANGPLDGAIPVDARLAAGAVKVASKGTLHLTGDAKIAFDDVAGTAWGAPVHGRLALAFGSPPRIDGRIDTDAIDAAAIVAQTIGMPQAQKDGWAAEPFGPFLLTRLTGKIDFAAAHAGLSSGLTATKLHGTVRFNGSEFVLDNVAGELGGGQLKAQVSVKPGSGGLSAKSTLALTNADVGAIFPASAAVGGTVGMTFNIDGLGLSPAAFAGSLSGTGTVTLDRAQFADLDPKAFMVLTHAVDRGLVVDKDKVASMMANALARGPLRLSHADIPLAVAAGQALMVQTNVHADGADLTIGGSVDVPSRSLNLKLALIDAATGGVSRVTVGIDGPVTQPKRSLDVSALTQWLALYAVEQQSKKLEAIQNGQRNHSANADTSPVEPTPLPVPAPPRPSASKPRPTVEANVPRAEEAAPRLPPPLQIRPTPRAAQQAAPPQPQRRPAEQRAPAPFLRLPWGLFGGTQN